MPGSPESGAGRDPPSQPPCLPAGGTAGNTYASMSFGSLLICCKQHKTFAWLPRPINNAIPTPAAVNRKQPLVSTIQQSNKHWFLLNDSQPGSICTSSSSSSASAVAVAAAPMPCPGSRPGMQPGPLAQHRVRRLERMETRSVAYRRQNPIHEMLQRAVLCSPPVEVQSVLMNPALGRREPGFRGRPGAAGWSEAPSATRRGSLSAALSRATSEHCSPNMRAGAGS